MSEFKDMPAFPILNYSMRCISPIHQGITMRDYFASEVLPAIYEEHFKGIRNEEYSLDSKWRLGLAMDAYAMADAMIEARTK